jgi:hypothetical protein
MHMVDSEAQIRSKNEEPSWLIATLFAGMGVGFIAFWVTLSLVYAEGLSAIGAIFVWPLAKGLGFKGFETRATLVYLVATIIGVGVGVASSFGSGMPVSGL